MKKIEKLTRSNALFLFIDYQDSLIKAIDGNEEILKNAKILAEASHIMDIPSIFTVQYKKGMGSTAKELKSILKESPEYDKISFSCMLDEDIEKAIEDKDRRQIIISGMESHICVLQSARDLLSKGYEIFLVADAIGSRKKENYENAINQLRDMGAAITNTETVLFDLLVKAGSEEFKNIQRLIK